MSTLKKLEAERIVSFELSKNKDLVEVIECCDFWNNTQLTRSELSVLIDELTEMRDEMINQ
jgi:hypothetical protein